MTRLLLSTAAAVTLVSLPASACTVVGLNAICSGANTAFSDNTDNLQIQVLPGATVQDSGDTLSGDGNDVRIVNRGSVVSDDNDAIDWDGKDLQVVNDGTIRGGKDGIHAEDDFTIKNSGLIQADDDAIQAGDGKGPGVVAIRNEAGGMIRADDKAITVGDGIWLVNDGTIDAGNEGFEAGDNARLTNTGTITAVEDGVQVGTNGYLVNSGLIESTGNDGDGIDIDDGEIINTATGRIVVAGSAGVDYDAGGDSLIRNAGLIEGVEGVLVETGYDHNGAPNGEVANIAAQTILNSGTIRGTGGTAILLGEGNDRLQLLDGAIVDGVTLLGDDRDRLIFASLFYGVDGFESLFDGGDDLDIVSFAFDISHLRYTTFSSGILSLNFDAGVGLFDVDVTNFETFLFADTRYSLDDLIPAPLPAGGILLASALAGFGMIRRRARG